MGWSLPAAGIYLGPRECAYGDVRLGQIRHRRCMNLRGVTTATLYPASRPTRRVDSLSHRRQVNDAYLRFALFDITDERTEHRQADRKGRRSVDGIQNPERFVG